MEIKKSLGDKVIELSDLKLSENFKEDNIIYQSLKDKKIKKIFVNGFKPNFYYIEISFEDFIKPRIRIMYDEIDIEKKKLFEDIKHLLLKYIYHQNKVNKNEYGIIDYFEIKKNKFGNDVYVVTIKYYSNVSLNIYVSINDFNFFKFSMNDKIYVKRNDNNIVVFDKQTQLINTH